MEEQGGLATEQRLLQRGEDVVEVGEHAVDLIDVGIPYAEQAHLARNAEEARQTAGPQTIDQPEGGRHGKHAHTAHHQQIGFGQLRV